LQHLSKIADLNQGCVEDFENCQEITLPISNKKTRKSEVTKLKTDQTPNSIKSIFTFYFIDPCNLNK